MFDDNVVVPFADATKVLFYRNKKCKHTTCFSGFLSIHIFDHGDETGGLDAQPAAEVGTFGTWRGSQKMQGLQRRVQNKYITNYASCLLMHAARFSYVALPPLIVVFVAAVVVVAEGRGRSEESISPAGTRCSFLALRPAPSRYGEEAEETVVVVVGRVMAA